MIGLLLLAAAVPAQTPLQAERAFAAAAQREGQWTAFRRFAAEDAVMFQPRNVRAQDWLKDRADPPVSLTWAPTASYTSCDGTMAANTGGWRGPNGGAGYFSTIWVVKDGQWKWEVDGGDTLATPRPPVARPVTRRAACTGAVPEMAIPYPNGPETTEAGGSPDRTLRYEYRIQRDNSRMFVVELWNGHGFDRVIDDQIGAQPAAAKTP